MSRFMAVEGDDNDAWIYDEQTGEPARIEFSGPNAFEIAGGCAEMWNEMEAAALQAFEDWINL